MATEYHISSGILTLYRRIHPRILILTLLAMLGTTSAAAQEQPAPVPLQAMSQGHRSELEALVNRELQRSVFGKFRQVEGAKNEIRIQAKFDLQSDLLIVDMGAEYGPLLDDPVLEDIKNELNEVARSILSELIPYQGIDFRYGGRDFYYYHPEARQYQTEQPRPQSKASDNDTTTDTTVVISPDHGYFKLYSGQNSG